MDCWVFTIRGDALARIYESTGLRLIARNIWVFLGESTPINRGMLGTLRNEPDKYFYYNNSLRARNHDVDLTLLRAFFGFHIPGHHERVWTERGSLQL